MNLVDTHTHLYLEQFNEDRELVVERAIQLGVSKFFLPNIDSTTVDAMLNLAKKFPNHCFPMIGLHPCSVTKNFKEELHRLESYLGEQKFYAIGEIGMDLYWDNTFMKEQEEAFIHQIKLAKKNNLPIVIHSRETMNVILNILKSLKQELPKGIFHCFSGTLEQAEDAIKLGFKLGISGTLTYKKSNLPEMLSHIDIKNIVLETDSPYLPPVPHRGKRNESSFLILVAQKLAEIYQILVEEVAEITTKNATEVLGI